MDSSNEISVFWSTQGHHRPGLPWGRGKTRTKQAGMVDILEQHRYHYTNKTIVKVNAKIEPEMVPPLRLSSHRAKHRNS